MRCEVVAVGTELLLGQIIDTNSSWIGQQLGTVGIDSHYQTKVGDNAERIEAVLRLALERSDAVIVCGGLGPTHDDITRDIIARVMGVELVRDEALVAKISAMFASRDRQMPTNNLRQADVPEGATAIPVQPGTAPGLCCEIGSKVLYAVPGVPVEMKSMMDDWILADIVRRSGTEAVIGSRTLRTWGTSESALAELLADEIARLDETNTATIAFLASGIEGLKVRITAKADDGAGVAAVLDAEEALLRPIIGDLIFGVDDQTMESVVLDLCEAKGLTLAVAESLTGGFLGARLTAVPGASRVFRGGIVAYASDVKFDLLGVAEGPVVSAECAQQMAVGVCERLGADVGIALTGVAGPDSQDGHGPGTVFVGTVVDGVAQSDQLRLAGSREQVRQFSVISGLQILRRRLVELG